MEEIKYMFDEDYRGNVVLANIDESGRIIDTYLLPTHDVEGNKIDYGKYYVPSTGNYGLSLLEPVWDFDKLMWYEGNPEGALVNEKTFKCEMIGWDTIDIRFEGFMYDGYYICCWGDPRTQWDTQMMMLAMRPTLTSVKLTLGLQNVTLTRDKFFEIYDAIIAFEEQIDTNVAAIQEIIQAMTTIEEVNAVPTSYTEAVALYL